MVKRVRTKDGDWFVACSERNWKRSFERMQRAARARHERMAAWERAQPDGARHEPGYWERYRAERQKTPIYYPMPVGHVMFGA